MKPKILFIFVEGNDDERFIQRIISPMLERRYDTLKIYKYAQETSRNIIKYFQYLKSTGQDYICLSDINRTPCITRKKEIVNSRINVINKSKIVVVIKEIESWYIAGIKDEDCRELKIPIYSSTNNITKEEFDNLIPKNYERIDFIQEILRRYSPKIAKNKNTSFKYFIERNTLRV